MRERSYMDGKVNGVAEMARLRAEVARLEAECEALRWSAGHDELTGLPNRRLFYALSTNVLNASLGSAVMMIDLDGFKPINDLHGHAAGDHVLRIIAYRLASWAGDNLVARLGGDEFAVLLTNATPVDGMPSWRSAVLTLAALIAEPVQLARQAVSVTASIGIAPSHGAHSVSELLHHADTAMYEAKNQTKITGMPGAACVYHPDDGYDHIALPAMRPSIIIELSIARSTSDAPTCEPADRDPDSVIAAIDYRCGDRVWVHRHGAWRPGIIEGTSARAILARYRCGDGPGTGVDTVPAECVSVRGAAPASAPLRLVA